MPELFAAKDAAAEFVLADAPVPGWLLAGIATSVLAVGDAAGTPSHAPAG